MAQDLKSRLRDCEADGISELQDIADEMFTRYVNAQVELGEYKARGVVLMQEIQRLEEENGRLRTELVDTEERYWNAHEEADKFKKELDWTLGQLSHAVKERTELSNEKTKLETQIRQMVARVAKEERIATSPSAPAEAQRKWLRQTPPEDAGPRNDRENEVAAKCPKCGSMDVLPTCVERQWGCGVCGEVFADG